MRYCDNYRCKYCTIYQDKNTKTMTQPLDKKLGYCCIAPVSCEYFILRCGGL